MTGTTWVEIPEGDHLTLQNAHIPICLISESPELNLRQLQANVDAEGLVLADLAITNGHITAIHPADHTPLDPHSNTVNLRGGQVWSTFVDMHTHLDKGHIWPRRPNPDGSFWGALEATQSDRDHRWTEEDLYRRMEFGLKCSYAHGTSAIRTHLDSFEPPGSISWRVFRQLQEEWRDRLTLQAASLVPMEYYATPDGQRLVDIVSDSGGLLGGFPQMGPELEEQCDRLFALAIDRGLDVDLHTDESGDAADVVLQYVARSAIKQGFEGQIVCGHCCSLAVQSDEVVQETLSLLKDANIGVVSLPQCNMFLQGRGDSQSGHITPSWRGITLLHELRQAGVTVAIASDNCRDPFHGFGDHDMLEVFEWGVKVGHMDTPYGHWPLSVTGSPAELMGLEHSGRITVGSPADLVMFRGRSFSELLARSQHDRVVLRRGQAINTALPAYEELDERMLWK